MKLNHGFDSFSVHIFMKLVSFSNIYGICMHFPMCMCAHVLIIMLQIMIDNRLKSGSEKAELSIFTCFVLASRVSCYPP